MRLDENTLFADRYQLERLLGRGGFGEVWLAKDNWTHLEIAIKVYASGQGMDANGLQDFCGELANVFDLNHTNLLKPTHVDSWCDMPYLIMAYCSQGSLTHKIGKITEEEMWKLIHDVASGLAYLHSRDVVHQDISPDNILIDDFGNYLITDFGISTRARSTLRKSVVNTNVSGGKTAYMGPERFSRQPAPTKASDIWSFGAMLFELLEGDVPFGELGGGMQKSGAEVPEITANVSDELKNTIYHMLSPETWDRPTAAALVKGEVPHGAPASQEPASSGRKTQRFDGPAPTKPLASNAKTPEAPKKAEKKKSKAWIWVLGAIVLIMAVIGVDAVVTKRNDELKQLMTRYDNAVTKFDNNLNAATIDNIPALEEAVNNLEDIREIENDPRFKDAHQYFDKRARILNVAQTLYDEADRKYKKAPVGTTTEQRNLEKRDKISGIKQRI